MTDPRRRWIVAVLVALASTAAAQQPPAPPPPIGIPLAPLGEGPWVFDTAEQHKIRVVVVAKGLAHPWSLAFLPDGGMLVTERPGRLRLIRNGVLEAQPVAGLPSIQATRLGGLMDVALHPRFADNRQVYFTYTKPVEKGLVATALARGRLEGSALTEVRDLFVAEPSWDGVGGQASRIAFARDGTLYMTTGSSLPPRAEEAQDPNSHRGKVLRLSEDGTAPRDNPFVGRTGYRPEIYTLGHRNQLGLAIHPVSGAVWAHENGPNGGDEINVILPGRNYGWPTVSFGRTYEGPRQGTFWQQDAEPPLVFWVPSIAVSGMAFYTGDRFPSWKGNVFVGALRLGEIPGTGHLQRVVFNQMGEEIRRESMLTELRQRIRDVRQGPDGLLYVVTDEDRGTLLRIEPAQ